MLVDGMLMAVLVICVVTDVRSRKIYNKVIYPGVVVAFVYHLTMGGWNGLAESLIGCTVGFGVLLIPYLLGGMGAGDVKLLALVGALKGVTFVLLASVYMAMLGGILALGFLLFRKGRLQGVMAALYSLRYGVKIPLLPGKDAMTATYPYGVAIAGGCVLCLWLKGWGWI